MAKKKIEEEKIEEVEVLTDNEEPEVVIKEEPKKEINLPEYYTLRIGETLKDVSKKFGVSEEKLKELNGGSDFLGTNQIKLK